MDLSNIRLPPGSRIPPGFPSYVSTGNYRGRVLKKPLRASFQNNGYLLLKGWLSQSQTYDIQDMVEQVREWPITPDSDFMPYHEINSRGERVLSRTENFADYQPELEALLWGGTLRLPLEDLVEGRQMRLFKEKINYKFAGSGGFVPHIDAGAYTQVKDCEHLTALIAVDDATLSNGCMEVVTGSHKMNIPIAPNNCIDKDWVAQQQWTPIEMQAGDVLIFGSYLAHRSGANHSNTDRRALYATYNLSSEGDLRKEYYRRRKEEYPPDHLRKPGDTFEQGAWIHANGTPMMSVDLGHQLQV